MPRELLLLFGVLIYHMIETAPTSAIGLGVTLAGSFIFENVYRRTSGRTFWEILTQTDPDRADAACRRERTASRPGDGHA
ncbi:MAG: hypothetical protein WBP81_01960 [Solirubrobacteraceae bacterium]